ncbi:hypothetical protein [Streptomyces albipurpureus]|uniref:Integral membrane protein n=1 Tax=Streptomyces albipurpureus TaxID=2897419 RepID=A0ABT0UJ58_9ACTN|nr:hypothetical protein [Streptomyces sp. CWNU-1]MCM2388678.1 hypothetical protein [Streptomyces sp. CWNU-1]
MGDLMAGAVIALICAAIGYALTGDLWVATMGGTIACVTAWGPRIFGRR